jgi:hypothetical protein
LGLGNSPFSSSFFHGSFLFFCLSPVVTEMSLNAWRMPIHLYHHLDTFKVWKFFFLLKLLPWILSFFLFFCLSPVVTKMSFNAWRMSIHLCHHHELLPSEPKSVEEAQEWWTKKILATCVQEWSNVCHLPFPCCSSWNSLKIHLCKKTQLLLLKWLLDPLLWTICFLVFFFLSARCCYPHCTNYICCNPTVWT